MTPQPQQAIRLLQLSSLDLQTEIQEALDSNPMLEANEEFETSTSTEEPAPNTSEESTKEPQSEVSMNTDTPVDIFSHAHDVVSHILNDIVEAANDAAATKEDDITDDPKVVQRLSDDEGYEDVAAETVDDERSESGLLTHSNSRPQVSNISFLSL